MSTYSVQIKEYGIGARWDVIVKRYDGAFPRVVAGQKGIPTHQQAESVARDYRAQFGVSEGQS